MAHNPNEKIQSANAGLVLRRTNGQLDWTGVVRFLPERLALPLHWREPRRIFVASMSDVFHPDVMDKTIHEIFHVMALCPQHIFQILTKRPERMRDYCREFRSGHDVLPNCWLGVSVEHQEAANQRIPLLLTTPAALRFISCEPLLGPLDLRAYLTCCPSCGSPSSDRVADSCGYCEGSGSWGIAWVIDGGESGPSFRLAQPDWFRQIRDQCAAAGISYFHKQNGGHTPKANGKLLDGVEHCAFPVVAA